MAVAAVACGYRLRGVQNRVGHTRNPIAARLWEMAGGHGQACEPARGLGGGVGGSSGCSVSWGESSRTDAVAIRNGQ
jgi:hypothetical protein